MRPFKKRFDIPIYVAALWVVISDDALASRRAMKPLFGECRIKSAQALCSTNFRGHVGVFLPRIDLREETLSHEIFHATHAILSWVDCKFDDNNQEAWAYLNGYISKIVRVAVETDRVRRNAAAKRKR